MRFTKPLTHGRGGTACRDGEGFNKHTNRFLGYILSKDRPLHRFAVPLPRKWEAFDMFAFQIKRTAKQKFIAP